ncbi:MAG: peptidylprolyl isomerase [Planctomycetota bacterium]
MRFSLLALAFGLLASLVACDMGPATSPTKKKPGSTPGEPEWTVTHILIATSDSPAPQHEGKVLRSKPVGKQVAESLIAQIQAGRSFDELVVKFTGDVDGSGKPNTNNGKPGSYTFGPGKMVPAFEKAAKELAVGQVTPVPVETQFGYHIIRRDK